MVKGLDPHPRAEQADPGTAPKGGHHRREPEHGARSTHGGDATAAVVAPGDRPSTTNLLLGGLLVIGVFFTLYYARAVFFPIVFALFLSFLYSPVVRFLNRARIPNPLGAGLVIIASVLVVGFGALQLTKPAKKWLDEAPAHLRRIEGRIKERLRVIREPLEGLSEASKTVKEATDLEGAGRMEVQLRTPGLADTLLNMTGAAAAGLLVTLLLLYFFLASGDTFLRKAVEAVPRITEKKRVVELVRSIESGISTYLFSITAINSCLGACIALAMWLLGVPNPVLWGVIGAVLNFIPYLGAVTGVLMVGVVALTSIADPVRAVLVPLVYLFLTSLEGYLITPMILGYRLRLNPLLIFISLIFWGWLWGAAGAFLAVPILAASKILCDRVATLQPAARFLET